MHLAKAVQAGMVLFLAAAASGACAQSQTSVGGIYSCVDAKGRRLTSDRPIPECLDREQRVLNSSGAVKTRIGPTLTEAEQAEAERKAQLAREEQIRLEDEKRRERIFVTRYPNKATHDKARNAALEQVAVVAQAAKPRLAELAKQRAAIDAEMEFYKQDPKKAPAQLRMRLENNIQDQAIQQRFIADQENEVRRVNAKFDEELARLRLLWAQTGSAAR
jgi:hypothetical protein